MNIGMCNACFTKPIKSLINTHRQTNNNNNKIKHEIFMRSS